MIQSIDVKLRINIIISLSQVLKYILNLFRIVIFQTIIYLHSY